MTHDYLRNGTTTLFAALCHRRTFAIISHSAAGKITLTGNCCCLAGRSSWQVRFTRAATGALRLDGD